MANTSVENEVLQDLRIFPNPATDLLLVDMTVESNTRVALDVMDLQGRMIQSQTVLAGSGTSRFTVDLRDMTAGMYLLQLRPENAAPSAMRFVVE